MLHKMERKAMHYSATEMAKKLDLSRSYLYYLNKNKGIRYGMMRYMKNYIII